MPVSFPTLHWKSTQVRGVSASLLSALTLGLAPIFGKQAMLAGTPYLSVVMLRTVLAAAILWLAYALFWRKHFYIYPVGLVVCLGAGLVNGLGSLMYYSGLSLLDASHAQLLYTLYPIFLTLFFRLDGYPISSFTLLRLCLALLATCLLAGIGLVPVNWVGVLFMVSSGALYALHLYINQHVLYDMPAPTVTLYTLTAMAGTVFVAFLLSGLSNSLPAMPPTMLAWQSVIWLTGATVISRLSLFMGAKHLGSLQAALLGLGETLVAVLAAIFLLNETRTPLQWLGAGLLAISILLVSREKYLGVLPQPKPWLQLLELWFYTSFQPLPKVKLPRPAPETNLPPVPPNAGIPTPQPSEPPPTPPAA